MTNDDFKAWRERHFRSRLACSKALELDHQIITALETGKTRTGRPYPVRRYIVMACRGWEVSKSFGPATE